MSIFISAIIFFHVDFSILRPKNVSILFFGGFYGSHLKYYPKDILKIDAHQISKRYTQHSIRDTL